MQKGLFNVKYVQVREIVSYRIPFSWEILNVWSDGKSLVYALFNRENPKPLRLYVNGDHILDDFGCWGAIAMGQKETVQIAYWSNLKGTIYLNKDPIEPPFPLSSVESLCCLQKGNGLLYCAKKKADAKEYLIHNKKVLSPGFNCIHKFAFSNDLSKIAYVGVDEEFDCTLYVNGERVSPTYKNISCCALSKDGLHYGYGVELTGETGEIIYQAVLDETVLLGKFSLVTDMQFSPSRSKLCYLCYNWTRDTCDIVVEGRLVSPRGLSLIGNFTFNSNENMIVYLGHRKEVQLPEVYINHESVTSPYHFKDVKFVQNDQLIVIGVDDMKNEIFLAKLIYNDPNFEKQETKDQEVTPSWQYLFRQAYNREGKDK